MVNRSVKFNDIQKNYQSYKDEINQKISDVIESCQFIDGKPKRDFESEFADYIGTKHCVGVGNGTDALEIGISSLRLPPGSEIITQPNSFIATTLGIVNNGLTPVFVDIDPDTYMIDHTRIEESITSNTRALCIVHLYGASPNMDEIMKIVNKYNLILIEDCAQAHGSMYNGKNIGTFGDVSCFSFYPGKNLGCFGDGGAVCTSNETIYQEIKLLANMGSSKKYYHEIIGRNSRLDSIQAAVLSVKLKYLNDNNEKRRNIAHIYNNELKDITGLTIPKIEDKCLPVWHLYIVKVNDRIKFQEYLKNHGVDTLIHYPIPIHKQSCFKNLYSDSTFTNCESVSDKIVSLPMFPELEHNDVLYTCEIIKKFFQMHQ